jgi:hypothetical protein
MRAKSMRIRETGFVLISDETEVSAQDYDVRTCLVYVEGR